MSFRLKFTQWQTHMQIIQLSFTLIKPNTYIFLLKKYLFNWRIITLQCCDGFLPYIDLNQPWVHVSPSILNSPPLLRLYLIPLGCPRAPALSVLLHASSLHWSSILHMVIYMFRGYSLNSLLPHSPKVCALHMCLFCWLAYRIIITVFLNSTYMH